MHTFMHVVLLQGQCLGWSGDPDHPRSAPLNTRLVCSAVADGGLQGSPLSFLQQRRVSVAGWR